MIDMLVLLRSLSSTRVSFPTFIMFTAIYRLQLWLSCKPTLENTQFVDHRTLEEYQIIIQPNQINQTQYSYQVKPITHKIHIPDIKNHTN